ncbi:MAG: siphovirus Gp157 family protein [Treponema sp.]|nr:siphovirus Gp157 family protein [Treponema sp.]
MSFNANLLEHRKNATDVNGRKIVCLVMRRFYYELELRRNERKLQRKEKVVFGLPGRTQGKELQNRARSLGVYRATSDGKMTLYDITSDILALNDLIDQALTDPDGNPKEITEEEKALLLAMNEENEGNFEGKAERICKLIQNQKAFVESCKKEEERLYARRKTSDRKVEALRWLLEENMKRIGMKKAQAGTFSLSIQNNPPSVYVRDATEIPEDYWRIIPEIREINKKVILDVLKAGGEVPGTLLNQSASLRIR